VSALGNHRGLPLRGNWALLIAIFNILGIIYSQIKLLNAKLKGLIIIAISALFLLEQPIHA
jgi:hypothetical protein